MFFCSCAWLQCLREPSGSTLDAVSGEKTSLRLLVWECSSCIFKILEVDSVITFSLENLLVWLLKGWTPCSSNQVTSLPHLALGDTKHSWHSNMSTDFPWVPSRVQHLEIWVLSVTTGDMCLRLSVSVLCVMPSASQCALRQVLQGFCVRIPQKIEAEPQKTCDKEHISVWCWTHQQPFTLPDVSWQDHRRHLVIWMRLPPGSRFCWQH